MIMEVRKEYIAASYMEISENTGTIDLEKKKIISEKVNSKVLSKCKVHLEILHLIRNQDRRGILANRQEMLTALYLGFSILYK